MTARSFLIIASLAVGAAALRADVVTVSDNQYATAIDSTIGEKPVKLVLTGAAVRKRYFLTIYTVGSYVQQGVKIRTPEELATQDCAKQLLLIMERDLKGKDMGDATEKAVRANYPAPRFNAELQIMQEHFAKNDIKENDRVWLTNVPGVGLHIHLEGKAEVLIRNPQFSRAVWDIYVGKNNLGSDIKNSLVSH
jgi:hypothetical protein